MSEAVLVVENKTESEQTTSKDPEHAPEAAEEEDEEEKDVDDESLEQSAGQSRKRAGARGRPRRLPKGGGSKTRSGSARLLHVSGQSPVKQVAGAISWISRAGECPRLLATLAPAINQAAKAVAIARKFLEEDKIDIACYPMFTPGRRRQDESFTFLLRKSTIRAVVLDDGTQELKVSKQSNPGTVAGAIAARVREGQRVVLSSIGPLSVSKAISSIAIARQYLAEDGVDISFRPSFLNIEFKDGRRSSCLQFQLLAQQI